MPTLHLLHGLPGSGKTAYARRLEQQLTAVRFTPDEWMVALHGTIPPERLFREQHAKIMALIWEHAARVLHAGSHVVLDGGFWSRASRDDARRRAAELGVPCCFHTLACSTDVARQRVLARTAAMPEGTLEIDRATFEFLAAQFEPMAADEEFVVVDLASEITATRGA